jgi:hypothetical protein
MTLRKDGAPWIVLGWEEKDGWIEILAFPGLRSETWGTRPG